jgi:uncharacterized membrane protein
VLTSVIFGADVGVVTYGINGSISAALTAGAVAGAVLVVLTSLYQWRRLCRVPLPPTIGQAVRNGTGLSRNADHRG